MSSNGKRNRRREYVNGKDTPPQSGDEVVGAYSYEQRVRMNDRFVERMEKAIAAGKEKPPEGPARAA
jgi:hypothetical protein